MRTSGKYAITFNTDGTFNATADCNAVAGTYRHERLRRPDDHGRCLHPNVACPDGSYADLFVHALGERGELTPSRMTRS